MLTRYYNATNVSSIEQSVYGLQPASLRLNMMLTKYLKNQIIVLHRNKNSIVILFNHK